MDPNILLQRKQASESDLTFGASLFSAFLCMLFGANAVAVKVSLHGFGVFTNVGLRFSIASLVIFLWAHLAGKPLRVTRAQVILLVPLALIFFTQLSLFYLGLSKTTASHGTLIANALPFVVMILAHFFIPGDTISIRKITGLLLGFSGVLVLLGDTLVMSDAVWKGDMLVLLTVCVWGCNVIYVKRIIGGFHPIQITLYPMLIAAPLFFLAALVFDAEAVRYIDSKILAALAYQTFVTASFGLVAWNSLVRKYGATVLHSFVFIMPLSGVFFGVILLGEPLSINLLFSILLVSSGLIIIHRKRRHGNISAQREKR